MMTLQQAELELKKIDVALRAGGDLGQLRGARGGQGE